MLRLAQWPSTKETAVHLIATSDVLAVTNFVLSFPTCCPGGIWDWIAWGFSYLLFVASKSKQSLKGRSCAIYTYLTYLFLVFITVLEWSGWDTSVVSKSHLPASWHCLNVTKTWLSDVTKRSMPSAKPQTHQNSHIKCIQYNDENGKYIPKLLKSLILRPVFMKDKNI